MATQTETTANGAIQESGTGLGQADTETITRVEVARIRNYASLPG